MEIKFDKKKSAEALSGLVQGTVDLSKKAVAGAKVGVNAMVEKSKADGYARRMKKYNPLFPEQYKSDSFHIPNIIVIIDDAVRDGIDVCEGSIGWRSKESGEEVLYLYDEAIKFSGIQFIPAPVCNAIYYVDHFDRSRYIQADCIFSRNLKEKLDELQHIAESVGAKRCVIDISESSKDSTKVKKSAGLGAETEEQSTNVTIGNERTRKNSNSQKGHIEAIFTGLRFAKKPTLKWFTYDDSINNLIETCCAGKRRVKTLTLELYGSTTATMSQSIACTIDGVMKSLKVKSSSSMESQAKQEYERKLLFYIEF